MAWISDLSRFDEVPIHSKNLSKQTVVSWKIDSGSSCAPLTRSIRIEFKRFIGFVLW